jgi:hypothetical protein
MEDIKKTVSSALSPQSPFDNILINCNKYLRLREHSNFKQIINKMEADCAHAYQIVQKIAVMIVEAKRRGGV